MRFLFFLLLKLIELTAAIVIVGILALLRINPNLRLLIFGIIFLSGVLGVVVWLNWMEAGDWADKWRRKRRERTRK